MKVSRPWLAVVFALFALPLFVGLGRRDITGDEAGHFFSVERILEIGDWLAPRSSPSENAVFLEKPPLKFWIVAAPIKLGLLPNDEFGLRFWDALFGGLAFLYVFAIGSRLGGAVSGGVAVLILFVQHSLLFQHGLRGNNMEAPLLLCYCGGIYHYMAAMSAGDADASRRWRHAAAVGAYFALGFMVKDVAALFMPAVLFVTSLVFRDWRTRLVRDWRVWAGASALALALIAPWFIYATVRFGAEVWQTMFGVHVYTRLTKFLDPAHVQPWPYYFTSMFYEMTISESAWLVGAGFVVLLAETIRRRWVEGGAVLIWFAMPMLVISAGTSKLYHYAYPYLPPAAIAGGYVVGLGYLVVPKFLTGLMRLARGYLGFWLPRVKAACERPPLRTVLMGLAVVALGIAVVSLAYGPVRLTWGGKDVFKSGGVLRPCLLILVAAVLTGRVQVPSRAVVLVVVASLLPLMVYRDVLAEANTGDHPMKSARDCILQVNAQPGAGNLGSRGIWVDGLDRGFGHEHYFYFRTVRPWTVAAKPSPEKLTQYLYDPAEQRPMLVLDTVYQAFMHEYNLAPTTPGAVLPPMVSFGDVVMILPGPYAVCSSEAANKHADIR
jgi:4-amino-4-deoxy-L-arabinose transferase-like glycosyltransferase